MINFAVCVSKWFRRFLSFVLIGWAKSLYVQIANRTCSISPSSRFFDARLGKHVNIGDESVVRASVIGDYSYLSSNVLLNRTTVGRFCSIGPRVLTAPGIHPLNYGFSTSPVFYSNDGNGAMALITDTRVKTGCNVLIGNDVWIGANVLILDGMVIGDGAVIGANAVVNRDVDPYTIVAGVPARIIGSRKILKDRLKDLNFEQWWDLDEQGLLEVVRKFNSQ